MIKLSKQINLKPKLFKIKCIKMCIYNIYSYLWSSILKNYKNKSFIIIHLKYSNSVGNIYNYLLIIIIGYRVYDNNADIWNIQF